MFSIIKEYVMSFFTSGKFTFIITLILGIVLFCGYFYFQSQSTKMEQLQTQCDNYRIEAQFLQEKNTMLQSSNKKINEEFDALTKKYQESFQEWETIFAKDKEEQENEQEKSIKSNTAYSDMRISNDAYNKLRRQGSASN